jgi:hypothetical protein
MYLPAFYGRIGSLSIKSTETLVFRRAPSSRINGSRRLPDDFLPTASPNLLPLSAFTTSL